MSGNLAKWAKDNNPNLKFTDGEAITGIYKGYKMMQDPFNPDREKVRYELEVDGKIKYWSSGNFSTAMQFDNAKIGQKVTITASGEGLKRRYTVEFI